MHPEKETTTSKKTNHKYSRIVPFFTPAPNSPFGALRKPSLLIILTLTATIAVYFTFFALATTGNQAIVTVAASQVGQPNGCVYEGSSCPYPSLWCAYFVSWVYQHAGYPIGNFSSVYGLRTYFQSHAMWHYRGGSDVPQPGDVVTFINDSHTGIVDHTYGTTLYTIEGNYANKVSRVSYANFNTYSEIVGWGRLNSSSTAIPVTTNAYFIKTVGGANGHVEVHSATVASGYQTGIHNSTYFSSTDARNGTWQMVGSNLYFIKTVGGANGHVEVHSATAASGYQTGIHGSTYFSSTDAINGTWQMVGSNLYFIKTVGGANGHVEVHSATAASGYQTGIHGSTYFSSTDARNGTWQMVGPDLYFIKTVGGANGHVEVHSATAASGYQTGIHGSTYFSSTDASYGTWEID